MKLVSFQIANAKSIIDSRLCTFTEKSNILVLAGQNEAGKTAILEALNFFRNGRTGEFEKLSYRTDDKGYPFVECTFALEDYDFHEADGEITEIFQKLKQFSCFRGDIETEEDDEIRLSDSTIDELDSSIKKLVDITVEQKSDDTEIDLTVVYDEILERVTTYLIEKLPTFILYSSFTDLLPSSVAVINIKQNNAVLDFQKVFGVDFNDLVSQDARVRSAVINRLTDSSSLDLNTYWHQKQTTKDDDKYRYDIQIHPNASDPNQSLVEFLIHQNEGNPLFLEQKSQGFRWFSSFNLRLKALGIDSENLENYVVLIDEPGQGLHERAQQDVKEILEELAGKGMQIVYSTHNPSLIGIKDDEILLIRIVQNTRDEGTKIFTLPQFASITGSKDALSPLITAMGISHAGQIVDKTKKCVVVEGITDHYYLSALKMLLSIEEEFYLIPACGVDNVKPLVSMVFSWGGPFKALFDDGANGNRVHKALLKQFYQGDTSIFNTQVKKMDGFNGIEDLFTLEDFAKYVTDVDNPSKEENSELAKKLGKEILARNFLQKVKTTPDKVTLSPETLSAFSHVFGWLQS